MRPQKVEDTKIITSLVKSFRTNGYEGTSLAELAKSTGLKKASLYHRFPKGKEAMAEAVLVHIEQWVDEHVFKILLDGTLSINDRVKKGLQAIDLSYDGGRETCIFRALSIGQSIELFDLQIKEGMQKWITTFKKLGLAIGLSETTSQETAISTLIKIQGSLIVTKGLNDISIFEDTLKEIEKQYLTQSDSQ